ncbi:ATP-binding protein [Rhizobium leguminosarum]|uniref:ATP-dependent nuclease n=1 Tax=Rhizobium leguminosarum TaxID=384 RepID=UPI001030862F|nr:ATP-binding protein [Rhizobium leguminosarum]TAU90993.1 ATP-binding protein [Rhizobium leguminosarum]
MLHSVTLTRFKRFNQTTFELLPTGISFLAGGNNSGKSTLLQAIAVWEFCRSILENERGPESLLTGYTGQGLGLSSDEFSPIAVASLKHLWTNLTTQNVGQDGYSLAIECKWRDVANAEKNLKVALALANDRLFVKQVDSNLVAGDVLPTVAYLPPFAGIVSRENKMSAADRRSMIGRGLAGGIIRNLILDMQTANEKKRALLKEGRSKIKNSELATLRRDDPWEILQATMAKIFGLQLLVDPFNDLFHTSIRVECVKGSIEGTKFTRHPNYKSRDLMAEGSGFLQWTSVYVLALSPTVRTLLLDEPDAHLHPSLQSQLVEALEEIVRASGKQVLMATHSTEILRWAEPTSVMAFSGNSARYLKDHDQKISLFLGLGSNYAPKLDPLRKYKRLLIVENISDGRMLKTLAGRAGLAWPENLVIWPWTGSSNERKNLFLQLQSEVPGLKAISIRDRDDQSLETVALENLRDKSTSSPHEDMSIRVWRRRHIENYLLCPTAIARATEQPLADINEVIALHALTIPDNFTSKDVAAALLDARGKEITQKHGDSFKSKFGIAPIKIAEAMQPEEVCEDVIELVNQIISMCAPANPA